VSGKCKHILPSGAPCKNWAVLGSDPPRCRHHGGEAKPQAAYQRCTYTHRNGDPCGQWAVAGTEPPLCVAHAGLTYVPKGRDHGMWRHGFYEQADPATSLEDMIDYLFKRQAQADWIFDYIVDPHDLLYLLSLHFKNARIIGQLLRAQQALDRDKDDLLSALGPALDLLEAELENE
jgi:hypothetical protein